MNGMQTRVCLLFDTAGSTYVDCFDPDLASGAVCPETHLAAFVLDQNMNDCHQIATTATGMSVQYLPLSRPVSQPPLHEPLLVCCLRGHTVPPFTILLSQAH